MTSQTLVAHWPLNGTLHNAIGGGPALEGFAEFGAPDPHDARVGALFDGGGEGLSVAAQAIGLIGDRDFTVSARIWLSPIATVFGDIVSQYEPNSRTGFTLSLLDASGVTTSHPNRRNVFFGTDAGTVPVITDHGRLGTSMFVSALAVHDGALFAGTVEGADGLLGRVFRKSRDGEWEDCGSPDASNGVTALVGWNGHLYAGTSSYKKIGSALPESENTTPGGAVFRYLGGRDWAYCGHIDPHGVFAVDLEKSGMRSAICDSVGALTVHEGRLYAIPFYSEGLFRLADNGAWEACGSPGFRLMSLRSHHGSLFCAANERGGVLITDGDGVWTSAAALPAEVTQTYSFAVHGNQLHAGTWPDGRVHRIDQGEWCDTGRLGTEREVMAMASYNGKFYGGTLPLAELYRLDDDGRPTAWSRIAQLDETPDVEYRRVWSMATFGGELYAGLLPSGRVVSMSAGAAVGDDRELSSGWHELEAVRADGELRVSIDGVVVARKPADALVLDAETPLRIGSGPMATFVGAISDVRVHRAEDDA